MNISLDKMLQEATADEIEKLATAGHPINSQIFILATEEIAKKHPNYILRSMAKDMLPKLKELFKTHKIGVKNALQN